MQLHGYPLGWVLPIELHSQSHYMELKLLPPLALVYYIMLQVTVLPSGCTNNGPCGGVAGAEARVLSSIQELSKTLTSLRKYYIFIISVNKYLRVMCGQNNTLCDTQQCATSF